MTANAGYHAYATGDVLTAAQVQYNLQNQTVMYFASSAARTTALTGVTVEGMVSYIPANGLEYYNGSAWTTVSNPGDITGVTAGTGISGGGTSGTVTITNSMATEIAAAGDIIVGTGSGTFDNLPIGTTAQVLTADTTVSPYKVKWATPASSSPLTTKGDLYTYSTTNARLAVGADYGFLQALASETTGNRWVDGAWTTYTPTVTAEAGSITSYTVNRSAYTRVGKLCVVNLVITITNKGTGSGALYVSAPFNSYNDAGSGVGREIAVVGTMLYSSMGSNNFQIRKYDATTVLVNNYVCALTITYEVA